MLEKVEAKEKLRVCCLTPVTYRSGGRQPVNLSYMDGGDTQAAIPDKREPSYIGVR